MNNAMALQAASGDIDPDEDINENEQDLKS